MYTTSHIIFLISHSTSAIHPLVEFFVISTNQSLYYCEKSHKMPLGLGKNAEINFL